MKRNAIISLGVALCIPALVWPLVQQTSTPQHSPLFNSSIIAQAQDGPRDGGREGGPDGTREGRPPGGPGRFGGPRGPMGGPGGGFRRSDKMQIGRFIREVGEMEKAKKTPLNKKQAQKIVATIAPWRKKASMSDADAKKLYVALRDTLTAAQKKTIDQRPPFGGPMGGPPDGRGPRGERGERGNRGERGDRPDGPPRGEHGFGGPGGPNGERPKPPSEADMKKMQAFMKTFNPLYPPTSYKEIKSLPQPMQEGMERRYKDMQAVLYQLSAKK
jgi:hypothetical protein